MKRLVIALGVLGSVICIPLAWTQPFIGNEIQSWITSDPHPNLSGTWTAVEGRMGRESWEPYPEAMSLVIDHDETRLSITEIWGEHENHLSYRLDGSESRNETANSRGETEVHVSRARWLAGAIVVETKTTPSSGSAYESMQMYFRTGGDRLSFARLGSDIRSGQIMLIWDISYEKSS